MKESRDFQKLARAALKDRKLNYGLCFFRATPFSVSQGSTDTLDFLPQPKKYLSDTEKGTAFFQMLEQAQRSFDELLASANAGDDCAMGYCVAFLICYVHSLEEISWRQPESFQRIARKQLKWPVLLARHQLVEQKCRQYLERIQLGEDYASVGKNTRWGIGWEKDWSVATRYAQRILDTVRRNQKNLKVARALMKLDPRKKEAWEKIPKWARDCLKLPPLAEDTAPKYFKVGWQAILEHTNGKPEDVKELATLVESTRKGKYARRYAKAQAGRVRSDEILKRKESPKRTADNDARSRIKERIAQALRSLAPTR